MNIFFLSVSNSINYYNKKMKKGEKKQKPKDNTQNIQVYKEAFELIDKNNDGEITLDELRNFFNGLGDKMTDADLQDMINEADVEGNGSITFDGFMALMNRKLRSEHVEEEIIETFKKFDQDNNGLIGPEDIYNLLQNFNQDITISEAEEMIRNIDIDDDGMVNYKEFVKMIFENK